MFGFTINKGGLTAIVKSCAVRFLMTYLMTSLKKLKPNSSKKKILSWNLSMKRTFENMDFHLLALKSVSQRVLRASRTAGHANKILTALAFLSALGAVGFSAIVVLAAADASLAPNISSQPTAYGGG